MSRRFWIIMFSLSFVSRYFLISSVIHWLFSNVLFSLHVFFLRFSFFVISFFFFLGKDYLFIYLFIFGCVGSSFRAGLSLVAASRGHSSSRCTGLSLSPPLLLRGTGSRRTGSVAVAHGPSCSAACGIFPDQGSNPCPLHWQADSQPLRHQGRPLWLVSYLIALWSEKMLDMISIFLDLLRLTLCPSMWSILENVPCALMNVYSAAFGWNVL